MKTVMDFNIKNAIQILERTPDVLHAMLQGLSADWTSRNEGGESWSVYDIIGHLIHGEKTDWIPRMEIILSEKPGKTFEPFDRFAQFEVSKGKSLEQLLDEFKTWRQKNIERLRSEKITDKILEEKGIHPAFGEVTLAQLLSTWVVHDLNHIAQIARVMAHQYHAEVGPWIEYLRILQTPEVAAKRANQRVYAIRNAEPSEFAETGALMVRVYSQLEGFPKPAEQPDYYKMLANVGDLTNRPETELLVAVSSEGQIAGAVVYFGDMQYYGSGGSAVNEQNAAGFRLLAVDPAVRGNGVGKRLTGECIRKAREKGVDQVIIHTTAAMQTAWKMYENLGFKRSEDLDFMQAQLPVFGFRLMLQ